MLSKQDEDEEEEEKKAMDIAKSEERTSLIKELTEGIKKELEAAGVSFKKQDSKESAHTISSKPEEQQAIIQAMKKQDEEEEDEEEEKIEGAKKSVSKMKKQDKEEEEEEEKQDEDEKDKEYPEVEKLRKEFEALKKSFDKKVSDEVETRLRKAGWSEEKGSVGVRRVALGVEEEPMLKKGETPEDKIAELAKLDYASLKKLEMAADMGELPPEIAQLIS